MKVVLVWRLSTLTSVLVVKWKSHVNSVASVP